MRGVWGADKALRRGDLPGIWSCHELVHLDVAFRMTQQYQSHSSFLRTVMMGGFLVGLLTVWASPAAAQQTTIRGRVVDGENNEPLPGVNVSVPGTTTGTATNTQGEYSLRVRASVDTLRFSFVGYQTQRVPIRGRSTINVVLQSGAIQTEELVVTALGIEREQRTIGYSVQEVSGADIEETAGINVINSLQGKLAGVRIQQTGTGQGGTSRIVIRGNRNIGSSNQPLFVVDGIPIQGRGSPRTGEFGGIDLGGGISDIDPNSIESITVLRGANAAALYGQDGGNGAIVIETKKGSSETRVSFSSRSAVERPMVLPDLQDTYGRGSRGTVCGDPTCPTGDDGAPTVLTGDISWGPRMEGQPVETWTGEVQPFRPQPDNVGDFFDTGYTTTNSLAFSAGTDSLSARAAVTHLQSETLLPGGDLERTNVSLSASGDVTGALSIDGRVSYVTQSASNRPQVARSPDNVVFNMYHFPRNLRLQDLQPFRDENGQPRIWTSANFSQRNNPFWSVNLNTNADTRNRMIGTMRARYQFAPWLSAFIRGGTDFVERNREEQVATNTSFKAGGRGEFETARSASQQTTFDFLIDAEQDLTSTLHGNLLVGGSWEFEDAETTGTTGQGLSIPNLFTPSNLESQTPIFAESEKQVRSIYSLAEFRYRNYLFLELTARNDWSSSLPPSSNSFFYPSATLGFIFSDLVDWDPLSFGKFRASVAEVGSDAPAQRLGLEFSVEGDGQGGRSRGSAPITLPPVDLEPEITTSVEGGLDLGFLDDRFELNFTYFQTNTRNQIINLPLPPASGFRQGTVNAGEVRNRGVELQANGTILQAGDFEWDVSANWSKSGSEVIGLTEDVSTFELSNALGVSVVAREGESLGKIEGSSFARTEDGRRIIGDDGLPVAGEDTTLGSVQPDWSGGITSTFRYGGFSLRALIDIRQGGDIFSRSNQIAARQGTASFTVEGREAFYNGEGGFVADGVVNTGSEESPNFEENTQAVDPQSFWSEVSGITEAFVYDGSFVKLREVVLSYRLPPTLLDRMPMRKASVSFVGRNLAFLHKNTPGFDPEATFGAGFADQGREAFAFPATQSFGLNLNLTF